MSIWAVVPIKPLNRAKSRLADALDPQSRQRLALGMLLHNLHVLTTATQIKGVLVISRDMKALSAARSVNGVQTLQESGTPELNKALHRACRMLMSWRASATLILPADVPLVSLEDIERILELGRFNHTVVIAPDKHQDGTNAIFSRPPDLIEYAFGAGSYQRHLRAAELVGAEVETYRSERLSLDIDSPADLDAYHQLAAKLGEPVINYNGATG